MMKHLLALIFIFACAMTAYPQGPAGAGPGPQAVPIQFVASAPSVCPLNRLIIVRSSGVAYMNILGSCTKVFNTAVSLPASASQGDLLYGSAANTYSNLAKDANATRYLSNTGTSNNPAWAQVNLANGVTGSLPETSLSFTDITTNDASITKHGFLPKLPNDASKFLNGVGAWATVSAGITNSAGANVVPKSDGTNLVTSNITDDGNNVQVASSLRIDLNTGKINLGDLNQINANAIIDPDEGQARIAAGSTAGAYFEEGTEVELFGPKILLTAAIISAQGTITAGGTVGAQTINQSTGSVNFAAAAASLVVTNSTVTTSSIIICTVATNDATLKSVQCVAGTGSFTMFGNAAAAAETRVNFWVITPE